MAKKKKLIRITTVPLSLTGLLKGQLRFMSGYFKVIGISCSRGDTLAEIGIEEGIEVIPVEMTRIISPIKDLKTIWELYRIFRREKPFIVHTHTPKAGTAGMIAAFLARVPHRLHTIAGLPLLEAEGSKRRLLNLVEKITYRCATKIYPNSFGLKKIILEQKFTRENKLKVIRNGSSNGIDLNQFNPEIYGPNEHVDLRKSFGILEDDFVFIFIGRLVSDKGINELVSAFKSLSERCDHVKLLLIGFYEKKLDPLHAETLALINEHPHIINTGQQADVRPYLSISHVLTFPSYREGFPNVVMEAGAMGLPSIVSNINGCNEIIIEGENGFIIPAKNTEKLFESMLYCYEHWDKINFNNDHIRDMIVTRYNRPDMWQAILKEYNSL
jgi:glycosyltransferase involved in cell wall biosynthesis